MLTFELQEKKADKKFYLDLTAVSKEKVKILNSLVNEGFEVRDVITGVDVRTAGVLLERVGVASENQRKSK